MPTDPDGVTTEPLTADDIYLDVDKTPIEPSACWPDPIIRAPRAADILGDNAITLEALDAAQEEADQADRRHYAWTHPDADPRPDEIPWPPA